MEKYNFGPRENIINIPSEILVEFLNAAGSGAAEWRGHTLSIFRSPRGEAAAEANVFIGEAARRGLPIPPALMYPGAAIGSSQSQMQIAPSPAPEAKPVNWALIVGGAAALYFVMRK